MSKSTLTRRAILAGGAATIPALATAVGVAAAAAVTHIDLEAASIAAAVVPLEPDPIIAAIVEHRRLDRKSSALSMALSDAEDAIKPRRPIPLVIWRNYMIGGSELERARRELLRDCVASPEKIEQEYRAAKQQERAKRRAMREWYKRNGLEDLRLKVKKAREVERDALYTLMDVRPTSAAGAGALITYVRRDMEGGEEPWHSAALANAARALLAMPNEALPSFDPVRKDLDLINAVFEMQTRDAAINHLHEKYGDDADSRGDYRQLEVERFAALETLRAEGARTSNGIVAKAEAVSERRLVEDYKRHGEISASLAADVLRYFGHRVA
jgi:hypothetical protein